MRQRALPLSTANMAAQLARGTDLTRTIAVPPGLTHEQAVAWCQKWLGTGERIDGFVVYT
jgi:hypothetical protein